MPIFVLMLAPLAFTTGVFVFAGVLTPMAEDLGVSVGAAGQLQSLFTITCAICGPVLALLTGRFDRKRLLVLSLVYLTVMNAASAVMPGFVGLAVTRALTGALGALALPLASTIAVALAGPERRARALAMVYGGITLAFLSGIPLGSAIGEIYGWRSSFWLASGLCAVAGLMTALFVPRTPTPPAVPKGAFGAVLKWPTTGYLLVTLFAFAAIFVVIGFVRPVVSALTGFDGRGVGMVQMVSGVGSFLGLVIGTRMVERPAGSPLIRLFCAIAAAQTVFAVALIGGWTGPAGLAGSVVAMLIGSTSLFATAPIVQSRLAEAAGPAATLAFALNGSMVYLGQGMGVVLGGAMLSSVGLTYISTAGIALAATGLVIALRLKAQRNLPLPAQ
ncbi:major facilitator family transporter [Pseudooceanicola batsensis HTCC2597]|uniref:Major facilitator family transporter n=1 Tax=Pseudooceanicola batsensis (strain ATCC BAA-863 / DSM 15984 / KCTC 12145 / HTCC2597) TaxID=252305 RepID=A3TVY6_PSEBH|nr:MFS transporter [Pseudooceanicola batsensis]EAQ03782.1 major facilitator family transporter [Pseudooceanicola batsensis HTCC2597]